MPCLHFFFFNDTATTEIYTLSLHDALPICLTSLFLSSARTAGFLSTRFPTLRIFTSLTPGTIAFWRIMTRAMSGRVTERTRSEEHTSELQSQSNLVCRLLLEKK